MQTTVPWTLTTPWCIASHSEKQPEGPVGDKVLSHPRPGGAQGAGKDTAGHRQDALRVAGGWGQATWKSTSSAPRGSLQDGEGCQQSPQRCTSKHNHLSLEQERRVCPPQQGHPPGGGRRRPPRAQPHSGAWFPDDVTGPSESISAQGARHTRQSQSSPPEAAYEPKGQSIGCFPRPGSGGPAHAHPSFSRLLRRDGPQPSCTH